MLGRENPSIIFNTYPSWCKVHCFRHPAAVEKITRCTKSEFRSLKLPPAPVDGAEHRHLRQLPAAPRGKRLQMLRRQLRLTQGCLEDSSLDHRGCVTESIQHKHSGINGQVDLPRARKSKLNYSNNPRAVSCCHFSGDAI